MLELSHLPTVNDPNVPAWHVSGAHCSVASTVLRTFLSWISEV